MGQCNQRLFLFTVCTLQLISIIERQVFDLLGYQWLPIAANFIHIIFVIIGYFGGYQYRKSYLISYNVWQVLWLAWNAFVICIYLDVGVLNKDGEILNLGTGAASWWEVNGIGCRPYFSVNATFGTFNDQLEDFMRPPRPDLVDGCLLNYYYVEVIHAALQLSLSLCGALSAGLIIQNYKPEDDIYVSKARSRTTSLYSVQYSSTRGRSSPLEDELELNVNQLNTLTSNDPNRPMTPRRVKRRSVSRGSGRRKDTSQRSRQTYTNGLINEGYTGTMGTMGATGTSQRQRESQRKKRYVNAANRIIDDSSTSNDSVPFYAPSINPNGYPPAGYPPAGYPPPPTVRPPTSRPPALLPLPSIHAGHSNPMYQSSRPNSVYSISAQVEMESRPPSAHSSYSNWHGQRPSMALPAANLHGHSPTPSVATTNTFGVPSVPSAQVAPSHGYPNRSSAHYYNAPNGHEYGHYG